MAMTMARPPFKGRDRDVPRALVMREVGQRYINKSRVGSST